MTSSKFAMLSGEATTVAVIELGTFGLMGIYRKRMLNIAYTIDQLLVLIDGA